MRVARRLLGPWLREEPLDGCPIVLLHCFRFVRQAAYLASLYPNVHMEATDT